MKNYNDISILHEIGNTSKCDVALFTTFNFDISFFDRSVLPLLYKSRAKICVFVDHKEFQKSLSEELGGQYIGSNYFVHPFYMNKAFHPKLILLLGEKESKLIVSSANLTYSSHYSNNELFGVYTYSENNKKHKELFAKAFTFFKEISIESDDQYVKDLIDYASRKYKFVISQKESTKTPILLTNYSQSLIGQISKLIDDDIKEIKVAVPFYDKDLAAITELKKKYPNAKIRLYLQDSYTTFPKSAFSESIIDETNIFEAVNNNGNAQKSFYHGKLFVFVSDKKEYMVYGSGNMSASALLRSYKNDGNVEAVIFDQGEPGCSDTLFKCFVVNENDLDELKTWIIENKEKEHEDLSSFINGINKDNEVTLLIKLVDVNPTCLQIGESKIENAVINKKEGNLYQIKFSSEYVLGNNIFYLTISDDEKTICLKCCINNINRIVAYTNSSGSNPFKSIKSEEDAEAYGKLLFFEEFWKIAPSVQHFIKDTKIVGEPVGLGGKTDKKEEEEDNDEQAEIDDSYLYDVDEDIAIGGNRDVYDSVMIYISHFTGKTAKWLGKGGKGTHKTEPGGEEDKTDSNKEERERKRQSFVNSTIKYFVDYADPKKYEQLNGLNFKIYFGLYEVFSDTFIIDMYIQKTRKTKVPEMVKAKIKYLVNRIIPTIDDQIKSTEEYAYLKKEIALLCLECHSSYSEIFFQDFREVLLELDRKSQNQFIKEIELLMKEVGSILEIDDTEKIISDFKRIGIKAPESKELTKEIINHFCIESCTCTISSSEDGEKLFLGIALSDVSTKQNFHNPILYISKTLHSEIEEYINRYFGRNDNRYVYYEISIENYTDKISKLLFQWSNKNYRSGDLIIFNVGKDKSRPITFSFV